MNVRIRAILAMAIAAMLIAVAWDRTQAALGNENRPLVRMFRSGDVRSVIQQARGVRARGDMKAAIPYYQEAIRRCPADAVLHQELGLTLEAAGEMTPAEQSMLESARLSKSFGSRWTLANFYFRRGRRMLTNDWLRNAQELAAERVESVFALCEANNPHAEEAQALCIGNTPSLLQSYLEYLINAKRVSDAVEFVNRNNDVETRSLTLVLDAAYSAGLFDKALIIWDSLAKKGVVSMKRNESDLVNSRFTALPTSQAFDWHQCMHPEVEIQQTQSGLRLHASGRQSETLDAIWQTTFLQPHKRYELSFEYRTEGLDTGNGPTWTISSSRETSRSGALNSDEWRKDSFPFFGDGWSRVNLSFDRRAGFRRIEGTIWLREVQVAQVQ